MTDIIACSVLDLEPDNKGYYSRAYIDEKNNAIVGVDKNKNTYLVLAGENKQEKSFFSLSINPTGEYLAIKSSIPNVLEANLYVYDLENRTFLKIDGQEKSSVVGYPITWIAADEFVTTDQGKSYRYLIKEKTRKEISSEEYSILLKSASPN